LGGNGIEFPGGRFLADAQRVEFALPDLLIHDGRQSCGAHHNPSGSMFTLST
jgi:hypothetical protein